MSIPAHISSSDELDGFTLVEIMIVVSIIALLAMIAIPNYLRHARNSRKTVCVSNLRTLEGAIEQLRMSGSSGEPTMTLLCEPVGYIKGEPRCPTDKRLPYDISGDVPTCPNVGNYPDHALPME